MMNETRALPAIIERESGGRLQSEVTEWKSTLPDRFFKDEKLCISPTVSSHKSDRENFISAVVRFVYDFVKYTGADQIIYYKKHAESDYEVLTDSKLFNIVTDWFDAIFENSQSSEVSSTVKNILNHINKGADIRNGITRVIPGAYWDSKKSEFRETALEGCFVHMDGPREVFNEDYNKYASIVRQSFSEFSAILEKEGSGNTQFWQFYKNLPTDFAPVKEWANERVQSWQDRYWDIMMVFSLPFFSVLPKRTIQLQGKGRCGKSTVLDVLKFEFGSSSAEVRISDFANRDVNNKLAFCSINLPDEEIVAKQLSAEACANFKTLATHKGIYVGVKNKGPVYVDGKFMTIYAGNKSPKWAPGEAEPCMQRMVFIRFTNFFGNKDTENFNFIEDVIKADKEEYARFIGVRLALAKYFSRKDSKYFISDDAKSVNEYLSVDDDSISLYYRMWNKYFDGVSNLEFHYDDYRNCCAAFGWVMQPKSEFRQVLIELHANKSVPIKINGKSIRCVRVPKYRPARIMHPDMHLDGHGTASYLHSLGQSVVAVFEKEEIDRKQKEEDSKINKQMDMIEAFGKKGARVLLGEDYVEGEEDE